MTENYDTPIKSKNLEAALEFMFLNLGLKFTPDAIKETVNSNYGGYRGAIDCSHASTGRMLRRAEQNRTIYQGLILRRGSVRNATDTDDLATFYLDDITPNDPEYTAEE